MKSSNHIFNKIVITFISLLFLVILSTYPLFNFASDFKYNVAVLITLLANQTLNSDLFHTLLNNNGYVDYFILGVVLFFQLTYLFPLWFIKKPFSKAMLHLYAFVINILFILFLGFLYNWFNFSDFHTINITYLFTIPFVIIGVEFITIFWLAVNQLSLTTHKAHLINNEKVINQLN